MDFPLPARIRSLLPVHPGKNLNLLQLKLGQELDATIIKLAIDRSALQLKLGDTIFNAEIPKPTNPQQNVPQLQNLVPGQLIKLLVTRLIPTPELTLQKLPQQATQPAQQVSKSTELILKLNTTPVRNTPSLLTPEHLANVPKGAKIPAQVTQINSKQIQLMLLAEPQAKQTKTLNQAIENNEIEFTGKFINIKLEAPLAKIQVQQKVILQITKQGNPPEFDIFENQKPSTSKESIITTATKHYLPKQQPSPELINQLFKDLPTLTKNQNIPETLKRMARQILQNLPPKQALKESKFLQRQLSQSGLMLETKIAVKDPVYFKQIQNDFKGNLLKLAQHIREAAFNLPDQKLPQNEKNILQELLIKTENSVARLIVDQLTSVPREDSPRQVWNFDIPYLDAQNASSVKIAIEKNKENHQDPEQPDSWSVTVTLTPPNLDTIHCKITFCQQIVNTHFWSEKMAMTQLIKDHLKILRDKIEEAGFKTGHMDAHNGRYVENENRHKKISGEGLLNEKI